MQTITKEFTTISGEIMKEFKNMIKGHKNNKYTTILNNLKVEPAAREYFIKVSYCDTSLQVEKEFETIENTIKKAFLLPIEYVKAVKGIKKGDQISFELSGNNAIAATFKGVTQSLTTYDADEFPRPYQSDFTPAGNLFYNDLEKLKKAAISTAASETRPILNNVLIRDNNIISTDSHRLYQAATNCSSSNDILLHKDLINYIVANEKKDFAGSVKMDNNCVRIETHDAEYSYQYGGGNYPDVKRLIPDEFRTQLEILEFDKFKNTLEVMKAAATDRNSAVIIEFENDKILIKNNAETIKTDIKVHSHSKESINMAFSCLYMLDALKQLESKNIMLNIVSNLRPFIVTDINNSDSLSLILPIRLGK